MKQGDKNQSDQGPKLSCACAQSAATMARWREASWRERFKTYFHSLACCGCAEHLRELHRLRHCSREAFEERTKCCEKRLKAFNEQLVDQLTKNPGKSPCSSRSKKTEE